jgi:hypothetical protein
VKALANFLQSFFAKSQGALRLHLTLMIVAYLGGSTRAKT